MNYQLVINHVLVIWFSYSYRYLFRLAVDFECQRVSCFACRIGIEVVTSSALISIFALPFVITFITLSHTSLTASYYSRFAVTDPL